MVGNDETDPRLGMVDGDAAFWGSHLFFDDDGALVGFGGFKGPPPGERSRSATPSPRPAQAEAWPPRRHER
jgi:hypothetical protein